MFRRWGDRLRRICKNDERSIAILLKQQFHFTKIFLKSVEFICNSNFEKRKMAFIIIAKYSRKLSFIFVRKFIFLHQRMNSAWRQFSSSFEKLLILSWFTYKQPIQYLYGKHLNLLQVNEGRPCWCDFLKHGSNKYF